MHQFSKTKEPQMHPNDLKNLSESARSETGILSSKFQIYFISGFGMDATKILR